MNTACWRGYVATWEVVDDRLFLSGITGVWRLASSKPIPATWISGFIRLVAGPLVHYVHYGYSSSYSAVIELDVVEGTVKRSRRVEAPPPRPRGLWEPTLEGPGISDRTELWTLVPEAAGLFDSTVEPQIFASAPRWQDYRDRSLRARFIAARSQAGLGFGPLLRAAGLRPGKQGGKLADWERGLTLTRVSGFAQLLRVLGISKEEEQRLAEEDANAMDDAVMKWAAMPITPTLVIERHGYAWPYPTAAAREDLEAWARSCARVSWRPVKLYLDRRTELSFDADGVQVGARDPSLSWREAEHQALGA